MIEIVNDYCEEIAALSNVAEARYRLSSPAFMSNLSNFVSLATSWCGNSIAMLLGEDKAKKLHFALTYIYLADDENMPAINALNAMYDGNLEQSILLTKFN